MGLVVFGANNCQSSNPYIHPSIGSSISNVRYKIMLFGIRTDTYRRFPQDNIIAILQQLHYRKLCFRFMKYKKLVETSHLIMEIFVTQSVFPTTSRNNTKYISTDRRRIQRERVQKRNILLKI